MRMDEPKYPISAGVATEVRGLMGRHRCSQKELAKHPDRGLSPQRVGELVTKAMWEAGVKLSNGDGMSPHALRHSAAHDMVGAGADILEVQQALGHRSIRSTMIYLRGHVSPDLRAAMAGRSYL